MLFSALAMAAVPYVDFKAHPRDTLLSDGATPRGFRIVALSHLAEACAAEEDVGCVERVYRAAVHPKIRSVADPVKPSGFGLYRSHLLVVLGKCAEVKGRCDADLHGALATALAMESAQHGILASYPSDASRYPADQAVTLYGLFLADETLGTHHLAGPLRAWHDRIDPSNVDGLPVAETTGAHDWSGVPRGCALSWTVQYAAVFEPTYAATVWKHYRERYLVQVGPLSGLREWPLGEDRPADADSGPIVMGVGAAATAFGIGAAHALDDGVTASQLESTEWLVRKQGHSAGDSALAVAISEASRRR